MSLDFHQTIKIADKAFTPNIYIYIYTFLFKTYSFERFIYKYIYEYYLVLVHLD
jgi:hypothetical protein